MSVSVLANISGKMAIEDISWHYICVQCGPQFVDFYDPPGSSQDIKALCLKKRSAVQQSAVSFGRRGFKPILKLNDL